LHEVFFTTNSRGSLCYENTNFAFNHNVMFPDPFHNMFRLPDPRLFMSIPYGVPWFRGIIREAQKTNTDFSFVWESELFFCPDPDAPFLGVHGGVPRHCAASQEE
jgi:hypothetical protein